MADHRADIEFVFQELIRLRSLSYSELGKLPSNDILSTLRSGGPRGMMIIGQAANMRLYTVAEETIAKSIHKGRLDTNEVVKRLKEILVTRFFDEERELDQLQADRAVSDAVKEAAQAKTNLTHFIPCTLGTGLAPETIAFGPVLLMQREYMLREHSRSLDSPAQQTETRATKDDYQKQKSHHDFIRGAREYLEEFDWITKVQIDDCDPIVSAKRAEFAVQCAIDCLHLILGSELSNYLRVGGPAPSTIKTAQFALKADGTALASWGRSWPTNSLRDGWWDTANKAIGPETISLLGEAIIERTRIPIPPPLALRFFDAVAWFREGIRDSYYPSRLTKFVNAMERLLCTGRQNRGVAKMIRQRGAILLASSGFGVFETIEDRIMRVYEIRSDLVHGTKSNSGGGLWSSCREAEILTQNLLLCAVNFFGTKGLASLDVDDSVLANRYAELLAE